MTQIFYRTKLKLSMKSVDLLYKLAEAFKYRRHKYRIRGNTLEVEGLIIKATSPDTIVINATDEERDKHGPLHIYITLNADDLREVSKAIYRLLRVYKNRER